MYNNKYDSLLTEISHYKNYPSLMPFIGRNYDATASPRILIIAESHYLPKQSTISIDADYWYNANHRILSASETEWMHTRSIASCDWKTNGHMIFRELEIHLSKVIDKSNGRALDSCAYMNGFQRPSPKTGDSIKKFCKQIDYVKSSETINEVLKVIRPNLVIFVSKFAWDTLAWRVIKKHKDMKFDFVCHPATGGRYWHKKDYLHGVQKFNNLISKLTKDDLCSR